MSKQDLVLNNLQGMKCHKTQPTLFIICEQNQRKVSQLLVIKVKSCLKHQFLQVKQH